MFWLKLIHTAIAFINVMAVFYILYCGVANRQGPVLILALVIVFIELFLLIVFRGCPLQSLARKLEGTEGAVRDIFLPDWLAANLIEIFTPITLMALGLVLRNHLMRR